MPAKRPVDFLGADLVPEKPKPAEKKEAHPTVTVKMAQGLVGTVQLVLANLPWTKDDVLDDVEQKLLVKDVIAFAKVNPFFARSIVWLFSQMGTAGLVMDTGAIVGKRLARRELVPVGIGMACDVAIVVSAAAHDIELSEEQAALASLFGGLMGEGGDDGDAAPVPPDRNATPDLVSTRLTD